MILLNITVDNVNTVMQIYSQIQIRRSEYEDGTYATVSGVGPVTLVANTTNYTVSDATGLSSHWYVSRYYDPVYDTYSAWSEPVLGEAGDIYYNPLFPPEVNFGTSEQLVIDRIRVLIGDPKSINREYGTAAESSLHSDGKVYEFDEKGYPAAIMMNGVQYNDSGNPSVNGYRFLKFDNYVDTPITTYSGSRLIEEGIDIWYYVFRWADREIMEIYDNTPAPPPLTSNTANADVYMLAAAYDILSGESWEVINEDSAKIVDEGSSYDPGAGIMARKFMLDNLKKRLDALVGSLALSGISGVLLD